FSNTGTIRASVTGCTFDGNTGIIGGGLEGTEQAFGAAPTATLSVTNSTFFGNSAAGGGGLSNSASGTGPTGATLLRDTLAFNQATGSGGGLSGSGISIRSSIVANNAAPSGPDAFGTFTSSGHNLIGVTDGSSGWVASDLTGTSSSPLDPL